MIDQRDKYHNFRCCLNQKLTVSSTLIFNLDMFMTDELGQDGPITVSANQCYDIGDLLMKGVSELGISTNSSYNSGVNNGMNYICLVYMHIMHVCIYLYVCIYMYICMYVSICIY